MVYCRPVLMAALIAWAGLDVFAVTADPSAVVFQNLSQSATVAVKDGDAVVPITSVRGHELYVHEHTYGYMIDVAVADGSLRITPKELEVGSYVLVVNTNAGEVRVNVYAPLSDLPNTYEEQAAMLGIGVDELKMRLGVTGTLSREDIAIDLPPVYYVGQTIRVNVAPRQHTMTWGINGQVVTEGVNANTFEYTFTEPGDYLLTYVESRDGGVIASDTAVTRVLATPPVTMTVSPVTEVNLTGPDGYATYTWTHDGTVVGRERFLRFKPPAAGEYRIACKAEGPAGGGTSFHETRYLIQAR